MNLQFCLMAPSLKNTGAGSECSIYENRKRISRGRTCVYVHFNVNTYN